MLKFCHGWVVADVSSIGVVLSSEDEWAWDTPILSRFVNVMSSVYHRMRQEKQLMSSMANLFGLRLSLPEPNGDLQKPSNPPSSPRN